MTVLDVLRVYMGLRCIQTTQYITTCTQLSVHYYNVGVRCTPRVMLKVLIYINKLQKKVFSSAIECSLSKYGYQCYIIMELVALVKNTPFISILDKIFIYRSLAYPWTEVDWGLSDQGTCHGAVIFLVRKLNFLNVILHESTIFINSSEINTSTPSGRLKKLTSGRTSLSIHARMCSYA